MSDLRQNVVSGTQPTGHAQISAEGHIPFEISDEQLPESQPEGLGFSQSPEGLQNPLTTDLESRQSELSEYVSGNNQRLELAERQRPRSYYSTHFALGHQSWSRLAFPLAGAARECNTNTGGT